MAKAKDKTVSMALAQQKIEECLTNPGGTNSSGDFAPKYPDYKYDITKTPVSGIKKLKELKVEVYKIINGKKVVGAAMAQLVPSGGERIYRVVKDSVRIDANGGHDLVLSKQFNAPEEGICIIEFKACMNLPPSVRPPSSISGSPFGGAGTTSTIIAHAAYISVDGRRDNYSLACTYTYGIGPMSLGIATNTAVKVSAGSHTINAMGYAFLGGTSTAQMQYPTMVIHYIPLSMVDDYDIPNI
ncbi:MAG: hypothetical protein ABIH00_10900 [Armatimonadota bacterium]